MKFSDYSKLTTEYEESCDTASSWNIYPRPQLERDSYISLCGEWDFATSSELQIPNIFGEKITVPYPPESRLSGIERRILRDEFIFYRKIFTLPKDFKKDRIILHFGAVDCICKLFVNRNFAISHEGGYIPFSSDITDLLCDGENEILLIVKDGTDKDFPYGKQKENRGGMWYTPISGIWQAVWLESLPKNPVKSLKITQNRDFALIEVDTDAKIKKLTLEDSQRVFEFSENSIKIEPEDKKRWTPDSPYLYRFTIETETDKVKSYFALRDVGIINVGSKERLCLNGEPYFFNGLLDQGYFPDGIFTPASPDAYKDDIIAAKKLGYNTLRKHIKVEPQIFYYLCDSLGIVVFQDMVNSGEYSFIRDTALPTVGIKKMPKLFMRQSKKAKETFIKGMIDTVNLLYNSPSVCLYTIFNEGWGQFSADKMYSLLKSYDSTRITDTTSGWFYEALSDVDSEHIYFKKLKLKKSPKKPVFLSEFGGYSLRVPEHIFGKKNYGYKSFDDEKSFENALRTLYLDELIPLIKDGLSAAIYTQLSDVEDETNGFLTYDRRICKIPYDNMKEINDKVYLEFKKQVI